MNKHHDHNMAKIWLETRKYLQFSAIFSVHTFALCVGVGVPK